MHRQQIGLAQGKSISTSAVAQIARKLEERLARARCCATPPLEAAVPDLSGAVFALPVMVNSRALWLVKRHQTLAWKRG